MKDEEPKVEQPDVDIQKLYLSLISNEAEEVEILRTKKKYKIRWLKNGQLERLTKLLIGNRRKSDTHVGDIADKRDAQQQGDVYDAILEDCKLACKAAAIIILDGYWKLKFWYWLLWRWFYYVKQYDNIQLFKILEMGKKKVPLQQFYSITMSLTEAKDTLMRMRTEEVEAILQGQSTEARSRTENSGSGS